MAGLLADPTVFFELHWKRSRTLLQPSRTLVGMLTERDILDLIDCGLLTLPYLSVLHHGGQVPGSDITTSRLVLNAPVTDLIDPRPVLAKYAAGATIVLHEPDQWHASTYDLLASVSEAFQGEVRSSVVLSPGGASMQWPAHTDAQTFLIQLSGESTCGDPVVTVHSGEVLYLPHGQRCVTVAGSEGSLHLAITVREATADEIARALIDDFAAQLSAEADHGGHHLASLPDKAARVREQMTAYLDTVDLTAIVAKAGTSGTRAR